ncbi:MAG: chemotaxis protein CheC [Miltoncostaeaceae bacterium]
MNADHLAPVAIDALAEIGNIGAGTAATALAQMTGVRVDMGLPRVSLVPVEDVPDRVGGGDTVVAAILLDVTGDAPGRMVFMMPAGAARTVVDMLMGLPSTHSGDEVPEFDEIALSALQEVGNVLTGAYLGALSTLTGLRLEPSPPALGIDMAYALLATAIVDVAERSPDALLIETDFSDDDDPQVGTLMFIPTPEGLDAVLGRLGVAA